MRRAWILVAVSACWSFPGAAAADAQQDSPSTVRYANAFVPQGHWSHAAIRKLVGLGLLPYGTDAGRRTYTQAEYGEAFEHAAASIADGDGELERLVEGYVRRYRSELGTPGASGLAAIVRGSALSAGWEASEGRIETGWGYWFGYPNGVDWNEPVARENVSDPTGAAELQLNGGPASLRAAFTYVEATPMLNEAYLSAGLGPVVMWGGRRSVGYGPGSGGGIVLTEARIDGIGIGSARPFELPWLLRHLGSAALEGSLSTVDLEHSFRNVFLLINRGTLAPHERVQLGVTRAAMFGGDGNGDVGWFDVFSVLVGKHAGEVASELDNQVVALDAWWRPPVERWVPLRLYMEWGFEDSAGAWKNVPGILAGIEVPAVPGMPSLSVGIEATQFRRSCCGNPIWYRHSTFHDGWTQDGAPIGHPLAGHGRELAAEVRLDLLDGEAALRLRALHRDRGAETLFAPHRIGESAGLNARFEWRIRQGLDLYFDGLIEDGEDWREARANLAFRAPF